MKRSLTMVAITVGALLAGSTAQAQFSFRGSQGRSRTDAGQLVGDGIREPVIHGERRDVGHHLGDARQVTPRASCTWMTAR